MEELNYFVEGWKHIMSRDALDHQLFIAALAAIYILKDWRKVAILVTAFTIGHTITLVLSAFEIITIETELVEFLIPCTIAVTALTNFFYTNRKAKYVGLNYLMALFFGLIHGLGFANFIRFTLADDQSIGWPLVQFNLGLEVGQVVFVTALMLFAHLVIQIIGFNRRWWIWLLSGTVFILALKLIIERFPF